MRARRAPDTPCVSNYSAPSYSFPFWGKAGMGASGGRTPAVCIARSGLEDVNCGLAPAGFGAREAPIPSFPQRREGAVRMPQQGSSGKLTSYLCQAIYAASPCNTCASSCSFNSAYFYRTGLSPRRAPRLGHPRRPQTFRAAHAHARSSVFQRRTQARRGVAKVRRHRFE